MKRAIARGVGIWIVISLAASARPPQSEGQAVPEKEGDAAKESEGQPLPAWQRLLSGDDAKRADELVQRITEREEADDYPGAVELAEQLLDLRRRVQGADHWETTNAQWTVETLRRVSALSTDERNEWRTASRKNIAAVDLYSQGKYAEAEPLFREAIEIIRKVMGEEHPETAASYNNIAFNLYSQGKYAEAEPLLQKALEIRRNLLGDEHPDTAQSHNNLAANLNSQVKYAEAEPLVRKALEINRNALGEAHAETATAYGNLAANLGSQGKHSEATALYQKALEIRRNALGAEDPQTVASYNNLARNLHSQGKYAEAEPLVRKAMEINRKLLGDDHPDTAQSYNNLAVNLNSQARYAEAAPLVRKALETRRKLLGEEHPLTSQTYNNVAFNLDSQGKYANAEPLYKKAMEINRKVLGGEHPDTAMSYNNLASNLNSQGNFDDAEPLGRKALEIFRERLGEEHPHTAMSYNNLARSLNSQAKYAEAEPLCRKSLEIIRKALGEEHPNTATSYNNVAFNLHSQRKYAEADPIYHKALGIQRQVLGEEHPDTALSYNNLAFNLHSQGKYAEAKETLDSAVAVYEAARVRFSTGALDRAVFGSLQSPYSLLAAVEARKRRPAEAWRALEADLARGLLDDAGQRAGVTLTTEDEQERQTLLATLAEIEPQVLRLATKADSNDVDGVELEALLLKRAQSEDRLGRLAAALSQRQVATLLDVQAALPTDGAWVAWVDVADYGGGVHEHWGCVLRSTGEPAWVRLPGTGPNKAWTKEDTDLPGKLRYALALPATIQEVRDLASRLREQRIKPLERYLKGVRRLFVASVHEMAGNPVEVLTKRYSVSYTPSGTQLAKLKKIPHPSGKPTLLALGDAVFADSTADAPQPTALPPGGLLIMQVVPEGNAAKARLQAGDVLLTYAGTELASVEELGPLIAAHAQDESVTITVWRESESQPATREIAPGKLGVALAREPAPQAIAEKRETDQMLASATRGRDWVDLPGTRVEVARLADLFDSHAVTMLTDSEASEQRLEELLASGQLADARYVHLATHGEVNQAMAFESALILSRDQLPSVDDVAAGATFYDGRLTAGEILEKWKLPNTELVTLSACESAVGREGGGDGFLGFVQALLLAGSRSVCVSLWKVDDTATALLMDRFYQNLLGRREGLESSMPKAEALAEAKAWLRQLSVEQVSQLAADLSQGVARGAGRKALPLLPAVPAADGDAKPYAHPHYWAAFVLIGDPE